MAKNMFWLALYALTVQRAPPRSGGTKLDLLNIFGLSVCSVLSNTLGSTVRTNRPCHTSEAFPCLFRPAPWGRELSRLRAPPSLAEPALGALSLQQPWHQAATVGVSTCFADFFSCATLVGYLYNTKDHLLVLQPTHNSHNGRLRPERYQKHSAKEPTGCCIPYCTSDAYHARKKRWSKGCIRPRVARCSELLTTLPSLAPLNLTATRSSKPQYPKSPTSTPLR
jgi:hypothetical protein